MRARIGIWVTAVVLFIGLASSALILEDRFDVERSNRTVEIVLDYRGIAALSAQSGLTVSAVLAGIKEAGATSVAIPEKTLSDLEAEGKVTILAGSWIINSRRVGALTAETGDIPGIDFGEIDPKNTYLVFEDGSLADRIDWELGIRGFETKRRQDWGVRILEVNLDGRRPENVYVGLWPDDVEMVRSSGLMVAPRLRNGSFGPGDARRLIESLPGPDPIYSTAIFEGDSVPGYPELLDETAEALKRAGIRFGIIEFAEQSGSDRLGRALGGETVRVHSITEREIPRYTSGTAIDRFMRAVNERNIRVLYLHPLTQVSALRQLPVGTRPDVLDANISYIRELSAALREAGFEPGRPVPHAKTRYPTALVFPVLLAVAAGCGILVQVFAYRLPAWNRFTGFAVWAAVFAGFAAIWTVAGETPARQAAALAASIVFPSLGAIAGTTHVSRRAPQRDKRRWQPGWLTGFLAGCGVTLAGGLLIAALLSQSGFFLKIDQFLGVKLMYIAVPAIVAAWWVFFRESPEDASTLQRALRLIRRTLNTQLKVWHVVVASVTAAVILVYIGRSGNSMLGVLGIESAIRAWLEDVLVARPRTKEYLIGHPSLIAGLWLLEAKLRARSGHPGSHSYWKNRGIDPVCGALIIAGSIGQMSMANSFTHAHTPLWITIARSLYGLAIGLVLGAILILVLNVGIRLAAPNPPDDTPDNRPDEPRPFISPSASPRAGKGRTAGL